ncbi:hypothetical protein E7Z59_08075 [Robertkochia marina]|uniref:Glycosyl hydrolase family 30 beta sandwich domain-containing protein n=1 Tax=Robertkochia marina TaxID=1227945 RepID=A0A4V3UYA1_9FLAO|nr:hypothetical protein E7Z59_08075 [Robertkochia marina]TRZ44523.1 hypothetical protein D3A96_07865 [Robertkochia marina]
MHLYANILLCSPLFQVYTPGSHRVSTNTGRSSLKSTTFVNTDGSMVTVVMNATEQNDQL